MTFHLLYRKIKAELSAAGIEAPASESSLIFEYACGLDRSGLILHGDENCPPEQQQRAERFCKERICGRPLQYILGEWSFRDAVFKVGEGVLIPRDDTEVLVNACADFLRSRPNAEILDLCSGSGIIAVTLKREFPDSRVTALEKSDIAFEYLKQNIALNKVSVTAVKADIFTAFDDFKDGEFDLIVSNPPYIRTDEIKTLQPEVQREPVEALDGGIDGLDFYRCIAENWIPKLKPDGALALEIGEGQLPELEKLLSPKFKSMIPYRDIAQTQRAILSVSKM